MKRFLSFNNDDFAFGALSKAFHRSSHHSCIAHFNEKMIDELRDWCYNIDNKTAL